MLETVVLVVLAVFVSESWVSVMCFDQFVFVMASSGSEFSLNIQVAQRICRLFRIR